MYIRSDVTEENQNHLITRTFGYVCIYPGKKR